MRRIVNVMLDIMLIVLIILFVFTFYQRIIGVHHPMIGGYGGAIVLTGSMEPNLPTNSVIIINDTDDLKEGDIITYIDKTDRSITHRIVEIGDEFIVTQGDANRISDPKITYDQVVGKVIYHFPIYVLLGVALVLLFTIFIVLIKGDKYERNT